MSEKYCMRFGTTWMGITPISWYGVPREVKFENRIFFIASKAELCAYEFYGFNWKCIPDYKKGKKHSFLVSTEIHSGNCEREYFQFLNPEKAREIFFEYKNMRINYYEKRKENHLLRYSPIISYIKTKIELQIINYGYESLKRDCKLCIEAFEKYMKLQMEITFRQNSIYIPIDNRYANLLFDALYDANMLYELQVILEIREKAIGLTAKQHDLKNEVHYLIEISKMLDLKDYKNASLLIELLSEKSLGQWTVIIAKIVIALDLAKQNSDFLRVYSLVKEALKKKADDGELLKYYGDVLYGMGEKSHAMKIYNKAGERLKDGRLLLELSKKRVKSAVKKIEALYNDSK